MAAVVLFAGTGAYVDDVVVAGTPVGTVVTDEAVPAEAHTAAAWLTKTP